MSRHSAIAEMKEQMERGFETSILIWGGERTPLGKLYTETGDEILRAFVQELLPQYPHCNIKDLECSEVGITDVGAEVLGNSMPHTLETLGLFYTQIGAAGIRAIARGAVSCPLQEIRLANGNSIGPEAIKAFAEFNPPFLRELVLNGLGIGDEGMPYVAALLQNSRTLEGLFLGYNQITDTAPISDALSSNSVLQKLGLFDNRITDKGIRGLAKSLYHNTNLKVLDLGGNPMADDESAKSCLRTALSHNRTVDTLRIEQGGFDTWIYEDDETREAMEDNNIEEFAFNLQKRHRRMRQRMSSFLLAFPYAKIPAHRRRMPANKRRRTVTG